MELNKNIDKFGIVASIVALVGSMVALAYYLVTIKQVIGWEIVLGVVGAIVGFGATNITYWFSKKQEREKKSIFLSYSSKDKNLAEKIERDLKGDGFQVLDLHSMVNVGESISGRIEQAMSRAKFLVLIMSEDTAKSEWIEKELNYALANQIKILPVVTSENAQIPSKVADLKFVSVKDSYEKAYNELKRAIAHTPVI